GIVVARGEAERVGLDPGHDSSAVVAAVDSGYSRVRARPRPRASSVGTPKSIKAAGAPPRLGPPANGGAGRGGRAGGRVRGGEESQGADRGQRRVAPAAADGVFATLASRAAGGLHARFRGDRLRR